MLRTRKVTLNDVIYLTWSYISTGLYFKHHLRLCLETLLVDALKGYKIL